MAKFKTKPVEFEAILASEAIGTYSERSKWPEWLSKAVDEGRVFFGPTSAHITISEQQRDDWIVLGPDGKLSIIRNVLFVAAAEPSTEET